ncbi:multicopper oxidase [Echria macrotheca]|uniref:Multicopper oxidase n=1 Tax=Echria macrotheca TaxID=438768 RepID=A0AAJ0F492_9PEZI|nr:multicopper oxidase [Echria macrotheca]
MHSHSFWRAIGLFGVGAVAAPSTWQSLHGRANATGCKFDSLSSPTCWDGVFDLKTNYYTDGPKTGKTWEYNFTLTNMTVAPDGIPRTVLAINGQIPGPTIHANWGDTVVVHVENMLDYAGTALHFHGIRQNNTNPMDGVASVTQCPIPGSGGKMTYTWVATQYGTSWYHSHYGVQAWDGVFGPIEIAGPASASYNKDLGAIMLSDWTHNTSESLLEYVNTQGYGGVPMNNGLINGNNTYVKADGTTVGKRWEIPFEKDKLHRIRFVNTAMDTMYKVSFDNHSMQVIAADFVPIEPFTTNVLSIAIGQRYDVIVNASAAAGNYWFRAVPMGCGGGQDPGFDLRAIVRYDPNNTSTPAETNPPDFGSDCHDTPMDKLKPVLQLDITHLPAKFEVDHDLAWAMHNDENTGALDWEIQTQPYLSQWDHPALQQISENLNGSSTVFDPRQQVIRVNDTHQWIFALLRTVEGTTHPIHLHGHDFYIVGQSDEPFNASTFVPQTVNPPRRDVAMVVDSGYLVIAFQPDNPGAWLLHCHIGWHTSEGFAVTFLEHEDRLKGLLTGGQGGALTKNCDDWKGFAEKQGIKQNDSGV